MRSVHKLGQIGTGQVLRAEGLLGDEQLEEVVEEQRATHERITDICLARGLVTEYDITKAMTRHLLLPFLPVEHYEIPDALCELLSVRLLHAHRIVPVDRFGDVLVVATCGDLDAQVIAHLETETRCKVALCVSQISEIEKVLKTRFPKEDLGAAVASRLDQLFGE